MHSERALAERPAPVRAPRGAIAPSYPRGRQIKRPILAVAQSRSRRGNEAEAWRNSRTGSASLRRRLRFLVPTRDSRCLLPLHATVQGGPPRAVRRVVSARSANGAWGLAIFWSVRVQDQRAAIPQPSPPGWVFVRTKRSARRAGINQHRTTPYSPILVPDPDSLATQHPANVS